MTVGTLYEILSGRITGYNPKQSQPTGLHNCNIYFERRSTIEDLFLLMTSKLIYILQRTHTHTHTHKHTCLDKQSADSLDS